MGEPFPQDITAGGQLVVPSIRSPNFVHNSTGWSINQDGSAEFHTIFVPPGTSGNTIFVQGTTPTANATGDMWINTSSNNEVSTWNGSSWMANQWGTTAIANGAITTSLLAAGIIYAGIVNGTTITGATLKIENSFGAVVVQIDGSKDAVFVYADTGSASQGSLIGSWAGKSGTDPLTSTSYPQGFSITQGTISGTTFTAGDTIINSSGIFVYSSTPGSGNLIASITPTSGTDGFGNAYDAGVTSYVVASLLSSSYNGTYAVTVGIGAAVDAPGIAIQNQTHPANLPPTFYAIVSDTAGSLLGFSSGGDLGDAVASISAASSIYSGITGGQITLPAGQVVFGTSALAFWDDNNSQLNLPSSGGPFINGEGWHTISNGTNITGTIRVKLLPWNAVWMDIEVSDSSATGASITCGSLPSAAYYPNTTRHFPLALTGSPSSLGTANARVNVPTSGAITLTTTTCSGSPVAYSCSVMYPTN